MDGFHQQVDFFFSIINGKGCPDSSWDAEAIHDRLGTMMACSYGYSKLVDDRSGSATDDFANAVKRMGYATVVGTNTGGGAAAYVAPPVIRLPNSGMNFRVETDLVINPDGSINEIVGTPPDIKLSPADIPSGLTREVLLEDEWIKSIMAKASRKGAGL